MTVNDDVAPSSGFNERPLSGPPRSIELSAIIYCETVIRYLPGCIKCRARDSKTNKSAIVPIVAL